jgi:hypothetical protein
MILRFLGFAFRYHNILVTDGEYLVDARTGLVAAKWQLVHNWRIIEGAFRDQFNPKRKTNAWKVIEVGA